MEVQEWVPNLGSKEYYISYPVVMVGRGGNRGTHPDRATTNSCYWVMFDGITQVSICLILQWQHRECVAFPSWPARQKTAVLYLLKESKLRKAKDRRQMTSGCTRQWFSHKSTAKLGKWHSKERSVLLRSFSQTKFPVDLTTCKYLGQEVGKSSAPGFLSSAPQTKWGYWPLLL